MLLRSNRGWRRGSTSDRRARKQRENPSSSRQKIAAPPIAPPSINTEDDAPPANLTPWFGWLLSAACHLMLAIAIALWLVPAGNRTSNQIVLEVVLDNPLHDVSELQTLEMSSPDPADMAPLEDSGEDEQLEQSAIEFFDAAAIGSVGVNFGPRSAASGGGSRGGGNGAGTQFFGTTAYGNRFVYVLDVSNSMDEGRGDSASEGSRYQRASAELVRSVEKLTPQQEFYVVLFSDKTRMMFDENARVPRTIAATEENKLRLKEWLGKIDPNGGTDPRDALRIGLELYPSAVFMLSDGEFRIKRNRRLGELLGNENVNVPQVVDRCNLALAPIHTVAFEDMANRQNMSDIAEQTGGEFRYVPPHGAGEADAPQIAPPPSKPQTGPVVTLDRETRAGHSLLLAKKLLAQGKRGAGLQWCRRLIEQFPGTAAAKEAQELIDALEHSAEQPVSLEPTASN